MESFESALQRIAGPRLQAYGYDFAPQLQLSDELFGFCKTRGEGVHTLIQFRQRHTIRQHDFTVNLLAVKDEVLQLRSYDGYAGARGARLNYVLWYVYGVRDHAIPDYWWDIPDQVQLETALHEVVDYLERYGITWLEAPQPVKPWEMPPHRVQEFADRVRAVAAPELERLGYRLEQLTLAGNLPYLFFSKALADGTFAFIELQSIYSLDPSRFNFDVRLQHRSAGSPVAPNDSQQTARSVSLAQLVWAAQGDVALQSITVDRVKTLFWPYHDRAELDAQLRTVLQQIVQLGLPWLDQLTDSTK